MADAVRISDGRRIPETAIVMRIVGNLYNKLCGSINGKGICGITNERGIPFGYGFSGSSKIYAVHKYPGGTKRFGKIECHGAISLKK